MNDALVRIGLMTALLAAALQVTAGDDAKVSPPIAADVAPEFAKLAVFDDSEAGFSMRIPEGFTRLTEADSRQVFQGISEHFGKQVGDRTLRRPPVWFMGPASAVNPKLPPPSLAIGYTDLAEAIDVNAKQKYKENLEQAYKKAGVRNGEIKIEVIKVSGVDALRIEHDIFSPIDNSQARIVNLAVPGNGRRYDIVFNYSGEQHAEIEKAVQSTIKTFKLKVEPVMDTATQGKWIRVGLFTIGGFVLGVVLMIILKILSGAGETEPEKTSP